MYTWLALLSILVLLIAFLLTIQVGKRGQKDAYTQTHTFKRLAWIYVLTILLTLLGLWLLMN